MDGLVMATLVAGAMLVFAGLLRLGNLMKSMPHPVITEFSAGVAVSLFTSQITDLLDLDIDKLPAEFMARWQAYFGHRCRRDGTQLILSGLQRQPLEVFGLMAIASDQNHVQLAADFSEAVRLARPPTDTGVN